MKKFFAEDINDLFGNVSPPAGMNFGADDPTSGLSRLIAFGIRGFIIVASMFLLLYLLWGAYDWIVSGGEKEKIVKAQQKITNAAIGFFLVFGVLVIFNLLLGPILGIIEVGPDGSWSFKLPTLK